MSKLTRVAIVFVIAVVSFFGLMIGKWYETTTSEAIDPKRGIFGMPGLEIWIDINMRMPDSARKWACATLLARETADAGFDRSVAAYPYSCQPDFGTYTPGPAYDSLVSVNLDQAGDGLDPVKTKALRACFDAAMAKEVTPDDIAAVNDSSDMAVLKRVVIAANTTARACRAEVKN